MKSVLSVLSFLLAFSPLQAQYAPEGIIIGQLIDEELTEPIPFANVIIKGTTIGTTTDLDGNFTIGGLESGTYTVVFSFMGYQTKELSGVEVTEDQPTQIIATLASSAADLDEVVITTVARQDTEVAMLLDQKRAISIKEGIGAQEMAQLGVSDAAGATTRISGVTSSEGSGDIFVRGLGDRYLSTTMNGLPIVSDDIERKNIDLSLFDSDVLKDISINKTTSAQVSADQASGAIDLSSRQLIGSSELGLSVSVGVNTNVTSEGVFDNFKVSPNKDDVSFGFYSRPMSNKEALTQQTWNPQFLETPVDHSFSLTAGKGFGNKLEVLFTGSHEVDFEYQEGSYQRFRGNYLRETFTDAQTFSNVITTSALGALSYEFNDDHQLRVNSLLINKLSDEVYEAGRNGEGYVYEETEPVEGLGQFVRDQNTKQTRLWVNQLLGDHQLGERNTLNWGFGANLVKAEEPNRMRNEINFNENLVQLGRRGGFQQRKTSQEIDDIEFNGFINDRHRLLSTANQQLYLNVGASFRQKERDFESLFLGLEERSLNSLTPSSIDNLSHVFTQSNLDDNLLKMNMLRGDDDRNPLPDTYDAELQNAAGYLSVDYGLGDFHLNLGARFQHDRLGVNYDITNIPGRVGSNQMTYENIYPSLNFRYSLNERQNLRLAASKTITLPEFKEIAPFEYVSATGEITRGNPDLRASEVYNLDLKWEFFPSSRQLVSLSGFYKQIDDPINKVRDRGSAGVYSYFNAGDQAEVYGLELEARLQLFQAIDEDDFDLDLQFNAARMWHSQELKEVFNEEGTFIKTYQYKGLTEVGLQGASDWIMNSSLSFNSGNENPWSGSISANYASDKIYALGAPSIQTMSETEYDDAVIEEGFVTLNALLGKDLGKGWSLKLVGKNLLNPEIKRTQKVRPNTTGIETNETVRSYFKGTELSLGISYKF